MPHDKKPAVVKDIRFEDAMTFIRIYNRSKHLDYEQRTTYTSLFGDAEKTGVAYTTVITQLQRVAKFAARFLPPGTPPRADLDMLFTRLINGDGGLQPTRVANALYQELKLLQDVYENVGCRTKSRLCGDSTPRVVRIGAAPNFAMHILPYVLSAGGASGLPACKLEMANTAELLPRLNSGLLDFVVGYGSEDGVGVRQEGFPGLRIGFTSFGIESKMVLAAHPLARVVLLREKGRDANEGYENYLRGLPVRKGMEKPPRYDDLWPVDLRDIDFRSCGMPLVVTSSWYSPPGLVEALQQGEAHGPPTRRVDSYEEAVMLAKLQHGLPVLPQVFSKRRMVHAFRLTPEEKFTRWIGAYYSPRFPLSEAAYRLLSIIGRYLKHFELSIRDGRPTAYPDPKYVEWWNKGLRGEEDWLKQAQTKYPLRLVNRKDSQESTKAE